MAKGWDAIEQATAESNERKERFSATFLPSFKIGARQPGPKQVRFLEQGTDINTYPVHEYKVPSRTGQGQPFTERFTCLSEIGQPCPGCEAGMKKKVRLVINVIERNRPQLRKGTDNKAIKNPDGSYIIDGYADEVVIANVGQPCGEMLRKKDGAWGGLMSREFTIEFSGDTFQPWSMEATNPGGPAEPASDNDVVLLQNKHDLDKHMAPPSYEEASKIVRQYGANSGAQQGGFGGGGFQQPGQQNQFAPQNHQPPQGGAFAPQPPAPPVNAFGGGAPQQPAPAAGGFGQPQPIPAPQPIPVAQSAAPVAQAPAPPAAPAAAFQPAPPTQPVAQQ